MKHFKNIEELEAIVWIQTAFIGDIVLNTAAFHFIFKNYPNIKQYVITTSLGKQVLDNIPWLTCYELNKKKSIFSEGKFLKEKFSHLHSEKTVCLQPHKSLRSSLLAKILGFQTITYRETTGAFLAECLIDRVSVFHESKRQALLLEPLGILRNRFSDLKPYLPPLALDENISWQKKIASFKEPLIGLACGSTWATKMWPMEYFSKVAKGLLAQNKIVVLLGNKTEKVLTDRIVFENNNHPNLVNLAGETTLKELLVLYPKLSMLITNDSSPIHFASAFNIKTIAIFGATTSAMGFGPLAQGSKVLELENLPCRPCGNHGPRQCPLGHFKCMKDLSVEMVLRTTDLH